MYKSTQYVYVQLALQPNSISAIVIILNYAVDSDSAVTAVV